MRAALLMVAVFILLSGCGGRFYVAAGLEATDVEYMEIDLKSGESFPQSRNPFGEAALGWEIEPMKNVILSLEGAHISSLYTSKDRGENVFRARAKCYLPSYRD